MFPIHKFPVLILREHFPMKRTLISSLEAPFWVLISVRMIIVKSSAVPHAQS